MMPESRRKDALTRLMWCAACVPSGLNSSQTCAFPVWAVRSPPLLARTMMVESQHAAAGQKPFTWRRCQLELYGYRVDARL
jgi:hypothetical protein